MGNAVSELGELKERGGGGFLPLSKGTQVNERKRNKSTVAPKKERKKKQKKGVDIKTKQNMPEGHQRTHTLLHLNSTPISC